MTVWTLRAGKKAHAEGTASSLGGRQTLVFDEEFFF